MSIHVKDSHIQPDFETLLAYLKAGATLSYGYETYSYQPKTIHYKYETNPLPYQVSGVNVHGTHVP